MHQTIDWFSWLAKTGLDPSLIYEYGMSFSRNELEEDDIAYFNHEFLQSMGISIAKHRLEILKLARKTKGSSSSNGSHPMSKLIFAIKKTKRTLVKYIQTLAHRDDSALVLVQKSYGSRWKGTMLRRSKRLVTYQQATPTLLLTNGNNNHKSSSLRINSFSSPLVYDIRYDQEKKDSHDGDHDHASHDEQDGGGGEYWSSGVQKIQWDAMFQNLKPT